MNKKIGAWLAAIATAMLVLVSVAPQVGLAVYEEAPLQIQPRLAPVEAPAGNDGGPGSPGGGGSGSGQDGFGPGQLGPGNVGSGEVGPGEPPAADKGRPSWSDWWKGKVDWLKQTAKDIEDGIVEGANSAWDTVSSAAVNAWDGVSNWAVGTWNGFSPQVRGALKGLVGGLIAVAVIALVVVVFSLGGWIVVAAMAVAVIASVAYGWLAGDNASILTGAVVGTLAGLATLVGGKLWLSGFQQMTVRSLLKEALIGGVISSLVTGLTDAFEILFLGRTEPISLLDITLSFVKGFVAALLLAPIMVGLGLAEILPRNVRRGLKRGDAHWKTWVWRLKARGRMIQIFTTGAFSAAAKSLIDTFKDPSQPPTIKQILGVGFVVGVLSLLQLKFIKQDLIKDTSKELLSEGAERVTDTVLKDNMAAPDRQEGLSPQSGLHADGMQGNEVSSSGGPGQAHSVPSPH